MFLPECEKISHQDKYTSLVEERDQAAQRRISLNLDLSFQVDCDFGWQLALTKQP